MLDFGNSNSRQSNAPRKKTGVFISEATIKSVSVKYDIQEEWQKRPDDIALYLDLDIGRDFDHQMRIGGYFNRNDDGTIKNWGAALKVKILLDYDDNPNHAGEAVRSIKILSVIWTKEKKHHGKETKTVDIGKGATAPSPSAP